jgi:hypothetical protein
MPFGLDIKSIIVGIIFALFVWPWISSLIGGARSSRGAVAAA